MKDEYKEKIEDIQDLLFNCTQLIKFLYYYELKNKEKLILKENEILPLILGICNGLRKTENILSMLSYNIKKSQYKFNNKTLKGTNEILINAYRSFVDKLLNETILDIELKYNTKLIKKVKHKNKIKESSLLSSDNELDL